MHGGQFYVCNQHERAVQLWMENNCRGPQESFDLHASENTSCNWKQHMTDHAENSSPFLM